MHPAEAAAKATLRLRPVPKSTERERATPLGGNKSACYAPELWNQAIISGGAPPPARTREDGERRRKPDST